MAIVVYWMTEAGPQAETFSSTDFSGALKKTESVRKEGFQHVVMSNQMDESVGKPGVQSVENGKTPDGHEYTWTKRRTPAEQRK